MYCRECMKQAERQNKEKKVNMTVDLEEQCYICPDCGHIIDWNKEEE